MIGEHEVVLWSKNKSKQSLRYNEFEFFKLYSRNNFKARFDTDQAP